MPLAIARMHSIMHARDQWNSSYNDTYRADTDDGCDVAELETGKERYTTARARLNVQLAPRTLQPICLSVAQVTKSVIYVIP